MRYLAFDRINHLFRHSLINLFFMCRKKKKLLEVKLELYSSWLTQSLFWVLKNAVVSINLKERELYCGGEKWRSLWFFERQLACKCLCTTFTVATCTGFPKNHLIIYLEVGRGLTIFVGLGAILNTPKVDCCSFLSSCALYHDLTCFEAHFFNFFLSQILQYWRYAGPSNAYSFLKLSWRSVHISLYKASIFF